MMKLSKSTIILSNFNVLFMVLHNLRLWVQPKQPNKNLKRGDPFLRHMKDSAHINLMIRPKQKMKNWKHIIREREDYLQKWIHWRLEFHRAILHENQPANNVVESCSAARASILLQKRKVLSLKLEIQNRTTRLI